MPRESFQQELDSLVRDVLDLGREVGASLENMVRAMETGDEELAASELGVDIRYKARGAELDRDSMILLARPARNIFNEGLDIFENRDIDRARDLQAKDDKVDLLYSEAMNLIANPSDGRGGAPEWRMRAALMVHYLERISDHGVDVGGSAVFLVTGQRIEDAMQQYLDRDMGEE